MIKNMIQAIAFTLSVVLAIVILIAMVYVSLWVMGGIAIVLLFMAIYSMLQVKSNL